MYQSERAGVTQSEIDRNLLPLDEAHKGRGLFKLLRRAQLDPLLDQINGPPCYRGQIQSSRLIQCQPMELIELAAGIADLLGVVVDELVVNCLLYTSDAADE